VSFLSLLRCHYLARSVASFTTNINQHTMIPGRVFRPRDRSPEGYLTASSETPTPNVSSAASYRTPAEEAQRHRDVQAWLDRTEGQARRKETKTEEVKGQQTTNMENEMHLPLKPKSKPFNFQYFFRITTLNLCSAIFGLNIVLSILVRGSPKGGSILDIELNWIISVPVASRAYNHYLIKRACMTDT
jgi:hypothetical protein